MWFNRRCSQSAATRSQSVRRATAKDLPFCRAGCQARPGRIVAANIVENGRPQTPMGWHDLRSLGVVEDSLLVGSVALLGPVGIPGRLLKDGSMEQVDGLFEPFVWTCKRVLVLDREHAVVANHSERRDDLFPV